MNEETERLEPPPGARRPKKCSCGNTDPKKWDYLDVQEWVDGKQSWAWNCQVCGTWQTVRINW